MVNAISIENEQNNETNDVVSVDSIEQSSNSSSTVNRSKSLKVWRPTALVNLINNSRKRSESLSNGLKDPPEHTEHIDSISTNSTDSSIASNESTSKKRGRWDTIVTVVLVEAKGLPQLPEDGSSHTIYCKLRLGSEIVKSKSVPNTRQPQWRERLKFRLYKQHALQISLWDKGKQLNNMGNCIIDLSNYEKERTHEIWAQLENGFGCVHLAITMCQIRTIPQTANNDNNIINTSEVRETYAWHNLKSDWEVVGQLRVKVIAARGLSGKPNAYCTLELDNERVQTPYARSCPETVWNKSYVFNVHDISSTLDLKIYGNSITNTFHHDSIGKLSIPLLRINNGAKCWYALKNKNKRNSAPGNCSRVLLEMSLVWNPVKATAKLFQPKTVKFIKKPPKFDVMLIYSNMRFVRDTFNFLYNLNEGYKSLFEWSDRELSLLALIGWLLFWYYIKLWTAPLLILLPFGFFWIYLRCDQSYNGVQNNVIDNNQDNETADRPENTLTGKIKDLPDLTITITQSIEYLVGIAERLYNLVTFKVPFMSYLTMIFLVFSSITLYVIPINYLFMALGIYKFTRKCINPERVPNNDLLDFISRIPDSRILKDWKELRVPEPNGNYIDANGINLE